MGQSRANDPKRREHVDLEQPRGFGIRGFLERSQKAVARVVDDHVDRARAGEGLAHRRFHRLAVGHVKFHDMQLAGSWTSDQARRREPFR